MPKKIAKWDRFVHVPDETLAAFVGLFRYLSDGGVRVDRVNAQGKYVMVLSLMSMITAADLDRTCLDELLSRKNIESLRCVNLMVKGMVDLGAEFVGTDDYWTPMFAENARRFEELAEGI